MTVRIPPHGTQYRYKGARNGSWPGCRCPKCSRAHAHAGTRRALAHLSGQPPLHPAQPLVEHIQMLIDAGMSRGLIARRAGVSASTIGYLYRGINKTCQRDKALRILAVTPGDFDDSAERPVTGLRRRIQALYIGGHSPDAIGVAAGLDRSTISHIANGHTTITDGRTATAITRAFLKLHLTEGTSRKSRRLAHEAGWAPAGAWDDIDDPNAVPDWTGHCGTDAGWWQHRAQNIPVCGRCETAHQQWLADHRHLPSNERIRAMANARAGAVQRGKALAEDARELLRYGHTRDQAAERLGIRPSHFDVELRRHPEEVAAA